MPFILPAIIAGASALPAVMNIGSKIAVRARRVPYRNQFAGASAFGLGYGLSTNVGYNLSNQYLTSGFRPTKYFNSRYPHNIQMPYGRSYSRYGSRYRSYSRYNRYGRSRYGGYRRRYRRYRRF